MTTDRPWTSVGVNIFGVADGVFRWGRIYTELVRDAGGMEAQLARMTGDDPRAGGWRQSMLRAEVGGLSIAYQRARDGPPLLHGFTHESCAWRLQLERLSDQFTAIASDAPGAGKSVDPPETFGISDWADCFAGFLTAVGVE